MSVELGAVIVFGLGFVAGGVVASVFWLVLAYLPDFRRTEAEIEAAGRELEARIAGGSRQRIPPQGGSGTAPPQRRRI
jgi:hypothetical protein